MSQKVINDIMVMTDVDDLRHVAEVAKQRIANLTSVNVRVGDKVQLFAEYHSRKPYDTIGKIEKINPKKFKVNFGQYGVWNIPKNMVKKVD